MKRTIVPRGILALSLVVVLLGATASTASAERVLTPWYCPPPPTPTTTIEQVPLDCLDLGAGSFDFGDRQVGTTSPAQRFALGVTATGVTGTPDTFNPRISVSGDYAQTNNCPPTLSATGEQIAGCLINVTFAPTGTGPKHGTLSTGPGGPTMTLTGTGVTTPTPPVLPLRLSVSYGNQGLGKKLRFQAITNNDSTLVASPTSLSNHRPGTEIKKTTKQLVAGEETMIKARLENPNRFKKACVLSSEECQNDVKAKIKLKATDEFDQTATDELKFRLARTRN